MTLTRFLLSWRTTPLHDREVVDALVDPAHAEPSPDLAAALRQWPGTYYWSHEPEGRHLILTRPTVKPREPWTLHAVLFVATLFTTTLSGAVIAGALPGNFGVLLNPGAWDTAFFHGWAKGLSFSLPLLAILLCHELGHYLTALRYQVNVSPPFFLPGPPAPFVGTFGAFIRLRTILNDRRQLLDIGAAGPIAGFLVALPVLWIGLAHSQFANDPDITGMVVQSGWGLLPLGDSVITLLLRQITHRGAGVILSPDDLEPRNFHVGELIGRHSHPRHGRPHRQAEPRGFFLDLAMPGSPQLHAAGEAARFDLADRVGDSRARLRFDDHAVEEANRNRREQQPRMTGAALEARFLDGGIDALERRRDRGVQAVGVCRRRCVQFAESRPRANGPGKAGRACGVSVPSPFEEGRAAANVYRGWTQEPK